MTELRILCSKCHRPIEEADLRQAVTYSREAFKPGVVRNYHRWCVPGMESRTARTEDSL